MYFVKQEIERLNGKTRGDKERSFKKNHYPQDGRCESQMIELDTLSIITPGSRHSRTLARGMGKVVKKEIMACQLPVSALSLGNLVSLVSRCLGGKFEDKWRRLVLSWMDLMRSFPRNGSSTLVRKSWT